MNAADKKRLSRLEQSTAQKHQRAGVVILSPDEWKAYREGLFVPLPEAVVILPPKEQSL